MDSSFETKNPTIASKLNKGSIKCVDPDKADLSIYNDHAGDGIQAFSVRFEYCAESATFDSECLERAEAEKFFDNNQVFIYYYEMRNLIDLTSLDFSVESDLNMAFRH